jgi:hypothetical protein
VTARAPRVRTAAAPAPPPPAPPRPAAGGRRVPLHRIAFARSGDKGDHANIGVAARSEAAFALLGDALTAARVQALFGERVRGGVTRWVLPGLRAYNFMLHHALGGGGTLSLRMDHQGKTLAQALLQIEIDVPDEVLRVTPADGEG